MQYLTPTFPDDITEYAPWVAKYGLYAPYGMCQCGCGEPAPLAQRTYSGKGHVSGQPMRFVRQHYTQRWLSQQAPAEQRFWEKVEVRGCDECWIWLGGKQSQGYGNFEANGKQHRAHRFSYELHYGRIPDGLLVCHECDNPSCVNPYHLFLGTALDNTLDCNQKNRRNIPMGEGHHASKLTEGNVRSIREMIARGISQANIARRFSVGQGVISRIASRKAWKHVK